MKVFKKLKKKNEILELFEVHEFERLDILKQTITNIFINEISSLNEYIFDIDLASKVALFYILKKFGNYNFFLFLESLYRFDKC